MASFYKTLQADNMIAGGLGQGGGGYWQEDVGERLQSAIAAELGGALALHPRQHGKDSFDTRDYYFDGEPYDLAYCQLFESCSYKRPAEWIYSIISDYISMEAVLQDFLDRMKPNLLITFQYPIDPPAGKDNLVVQCNTVGCKVVFLPWFNSQNAEDHSWIRDIDAMCTGKIGGTYPFRDAAFKALEKLQATTGYNIILSGNPHGSTFPLEYDEYIKCLDRCHYYVTGGIYDMQIPPKYYEVCNHGATLVSPELPMMATNSPSPIESVRSTSALTSVSPCSLVRSPESSPFSILPVNFDVLSWPPKLVTFVKLSLLSSNFTSLRSLTPQKMIHWPVYPSWFLENARIDSNSRSMLANFILTRQSPYSPPLPDLD